MEYAFSTSWKTHMRRRDVSIEPPATDFRASPNAFAAERGDL